MSTGTGKATRNAVVFGGVVLIWLAIDRLTKMWAGSASPGTLLGDGIPGLFDFRLVRNSGAAWGIFDGATVALGVFAVVFCAALLGVAHVRRDKAGALEMVGYGLVLAGGIGNAIDRFLDGYVVDFIEATFVDFPVFNIADIGVTCGFAIIAIAVLFLDKPDAEGDG